MAERHWVGGTGAWNDTAHWSATQGGAGGQSVPSLDDDVFFDAGSFSAADQVVTIDYVGQKYCKNLNFTGATNTPTFAMASYMSLQIYGSLTLISAMVLDIAGYSGFSFKATSGSHTITLAGQDISCYLEFNGYETTGTWTFQDACNLNDNNDLGSAYSGIILYGGTLDFNNQTFVIPYLTLSGTSTRSLVLGTSDITITDSESTSLYANGENLTIDAGTSSITFTKSGATIFLENGDFEFYDIITEKSIRILGNNFTSAPSTNILTVHDLTFQNADEITISMQVYVEGTLSANDSGNTYFIHSLSFNDQVQINAEAISFGVVVFNGVVAGGTAAPFTGTHLGNASNNFNITFETTKTLYWIGANEGNWDDQSNWSLTSGGSAANVGAPLPQDNVIFDANSETGGGELYVYYSTSVALLFVGNLTTNAFTEDLYLDEIFVSGNLLLGSTVLQAFFTCIGNLAQTITSNGASGIILYVKKSSSSTLTLLDDLVVSQVTVFTGIFDANDNNITGAFHFVGGPFTINMGSGVWETIANDSMAGFWDMDNVLPGTSVVNAETSTIRVTVSEDTTAEIVFNGGEMTYNRLEIVNAYNPEIKITAVGILYGEGEEGSNTVIFNDGIYITGDGQTVRFANGAIFIINALDCTGSAGNLIGLKAITDVTDSGDPFTLRKLGSGDIMVDYCEIRDSVASGNVDWFANHSDDVSGNSGWLFLPLKKTVSADAIILDRLTKTFTGDALVSIRATQTVLSDGYIASRLTKTAAIDGLVAVRSTKTLTLDGVVASRTTTTLTADASVKDVFTKLLTANAIIAATLLKTVTINAYVAEAKTILIGADAIIVDQITGTAPTVKRNPVTGILKVMPQVPIKKKASKRPTMFVR